MAEQAKGAGAAAKPGAPKKKIRKGVTRGIAHIKATFNNTIVTITDTNGETISWASAGTVGLQGRPQEHPVRRRPRRRERRPARPARAAWSRSRSR